MTDNIFTKLLTLILALFGGNTRTTETSISSSYVGTYRLTAVYNKKQESILLPSPDYSFDIKDDETTKSSNDYSFGITLGNVMGAGFTVIPNEESSNQSDAVTFSPLFSTKMMPPKDVFALEIALGDALNNTTSIELNDENFIIISGENGKVEGTKID